MTGVTIAASGMPQPGDPCPGFTVDPGRCWRMVYSKQLQATHCAEPPSWTGRWFSPSRRPVVVGCGRVPAIWTD
jgi:hypothetical protein